MITLINNSSTRALINYNHQVLSLIFPNPFTKTRKCSDKYWLKRDNKDKDAIAEFISGFHDKRWDSQITTTESNGTLDFRRSIFTLPTHDNQYLKCILIENQDVFDIEPDCEIYLLDREVLVTWEEFQISIGKEYNMMITPQKV